MVTFTLTYKRNIVILHDVLTPHDRSVGERAHTRSKRGLLLLRYKPIAYVELDSSF